jgi:serine/threonine-protein kinase Chk2
VRDLGSYAGTEVTYDKQGEGTRRDFDWVIGGHPVPQEKEAIVINLNGDIAFQIVVSYHDLTSQLYIDNVDRFRQGTANAEDLLGQMGLQRSQTELPSGVQTPGKGKILLRKKLGEGAFGVVTHIWNVSTAEEYALKKPTKKAIREQTVDVEAWKNEARIMEGIKHVS